MEIIAFGIFCLMTVGVFAYHTYEDEIKEWEDRWLER